MVSRLHVLLCREGWAINWKRAYQVYHEAGLMVRRRQRKRITGIERQEKVAADGRRLRALNIIDDFTKECLAIEIDTSLSERRVKAILERLA